MAQFVMKHKVKEKFGTTHSGDNGGDSGGARGLTAADFEISSAATSTEEIGNPVYPPARRLLNSKGIDCSGHKARQMTQRDFDYYDYIVLMDRNNLRNLRWILGREIHPEKDRKISMMMDWTDRAGDVADPWYTGDFEATWRDVNEGCDGLLEHIMGRKMKCKQEQQP